MKVWKWVAWVSCGLVLVGAFIGGMIWWNTEGSKTDLEKRGLPDRGLPVMEITLTDGLELSEIDGGSKDVKYEGNKVTLYERGKATEFDGVELKGRGNGTWLNEKKPYRIKFDEKVDLFGMGKARKWNLLANMADTVNLRTEVAFDLEKMLGMDCAFRGDFVELYVEGEYRGLYYVTRVVEISKDLVDLRDPMGVLVELDNMYGRNEKSYETGNGDLLVVKDLVRKNEEEVVMDDFLKDYNELEIAIGENNYVKIEELIDVESFAQYYLLSEFTVNPDAYWTSFYMYRDGPNDVIHAGPGWDFDLSLGNRNWGNWLGERFYSPNETMVRKLEKKLPKEFYESENIEGGYEAGLVLTGLMFDLMDIPEFRDEVSRVFQEKMAGRKQELINMILIKADEIRLAVEADGGKWEKGNFEEELDKMIEWIMARYDYFEKEYGGGYPVEEGVI